jgi:hypothetical protein
MNKKKENIIRPEMTVLDIVSRFRSTEKIFKQWDNKAGECICCNSLFDALQTVAAKYDINLATLMVELETAAEKEN